jgi:hypothetical protein
LPIFFSRLSVCKLIEFEERESLLDAMDGSSFKLRRNFSLSPETEAYLEREIPSDVSRNRKGEHRNYRENCPQLRPTMAARFLLVLAACAGSVVHKSGVA